MDNVYLPCRLARQPCLAALLGNLARQPCSATLPGNLALHIFTGLRTELIFSLVFQKKNPTNFFSIFFLIFPKNKSKKNLPIFFPPTILY
jgi:hypothetical protein